MNEQERAWRQVLENLTDAELEAFIDRLKQLNARPIDRHFNQRPQDIDLIVIK